MEKVALDVIPEEKENKIIPLELQKEVPAQIELPSSTVTQKNLLKSIITLKSAPREVLSLKKNRGVTRLSFKSLTRPIRVILRNWKSLIRSILVQKNLKNLTKSILLQKSPRRSLAQIDLKYPRRDPRHALGQRNQTNILQRKKIRR